MTAPLQQVLARLENVTPSGSGYSARCPAHDDAHPSLSISEGENGRVLLYCHGGCAPGAIVGALGLGMSDLFGETLLPESVAPREVDKYPYVDADSVFLFETVRFEPKTFRQRRRLEDGRWTWKIGDVKRPIYNLPSVNAANARGERIYVVEGEKDVEALRAIGLTGTTNPLGAGKWRSEHAEALIGANVVVIPDNDPAGREHAAMVYESLRGRSASVSVLELPDLGPKGDVSEWLGKGGTAEELQRLADLSGQRAPSWIDGGLQRELALTASSRPLFRLIHDSELHRLAEQSWLVEGVIPARSLTLAYGLRDTVKSFGAIDLAYHIGTGRTWHGMQVQQGSVVYIAAEGASGIRQRVASWKEHHGISTVVDVTFVDEAVQLMTRGDIDRLVATLASRGCHPALIVFDTFARCLSGGDENSARDVGIAVTALDRLRKEVGTAVYVIHHMTRGTRHERGSTALGDAADVTLFFERKVEDRLTIENLKQKDAKEHAPISLKLLEVGESAVLVDAPLSGRSAKAIPTGNRLTLLDSLPRERGLSYSEWLKVTNRPKSSFDRDREWLVENGFVVKVENGTGAVYVRADVE